MRLGVFAFWPYSSVCRVWAACFLNGVPMCSTVTSRPRCTQVYVHTPCVGHCAAIVPTAVKRSKGGRSPLEYLIVSMLPAYQLCRQCTGIVPISHQPWVVVLCMPPLERKRLPCRLTVSHFSVHIKGREQTPKSTRPVGWPNLRFVGTRKTIDARGPPVFHRRPC